MGASHKCKPTAQSMHIVFKGEKQGELVTLPSLHDADEWTRFEAARRAISKRFGNSVPAPRYGIRVTEPAYE